MGGEGVHSHPKLVRSRSHRLGSFKRQVGAFAYAVCSFRGHVGSLPHEVRSFTLPVSAFTNNAQNKKPRIHCGTPHPNKQY